MLPRSFQVKNRSLPFGHFLAPDHPIGIVMKHLPLVSSSFGIEITYRYVSVLLKIARGTLGLEVILPVAAAEEDCVLRHAARCHCGGNKRRRRCRPALVRGRNDRVPLDGINVVRYRSHRPAQFTARRNATRH